MRLPGDPPGEFFDLPGQFRKIGHMRVHPLEFGEGPRGRAPHEEAPADDLPGKDSGLGTDDGFTLDPHVVAYAHLPTDNRLITMSRAFGARDSQIFMKVSLPGSLPYIVAGMRVALGRALVYIVVAEQYGAAMGLGYLSSVAAQRFQMAAMFVPIVIIAGLGAGLNETLKAFERRLDKWKPQKS